MEIIQYSHIGPRDENQDRTGFRILGDDSCICVVADGIGGYDFGAEAAESFVMGFLTYARWHYGTESPVVLLKNAFANGDKAVLDARCNVITTKLIGTVAVSALVIGNKAYIAWIGDSRASLIRNGQIIKQTVDHSYIESIKAAGKIPTDLQIQNFSSMVTKAIHGFLDAHKLVEIEEWDIESDDVLILSSDGLHNHFDIANLSTEEIALKDYLDGNVDNMRDNTSLVMVLNC